MRAVHQFHPGCGSGDGITNGLFLTRRILRSLGYESEIFAEHIPQELSSRVHHVSRFEDRANDVLLFHHSLGYPEIRWIEDVTAHRVLVYHNVTPDFLLPEGGLRDLSRLGRDQLPGIKNLFDASIADSEENAKELEGFGYRDVRVLPLLIDFDRYARLQPNQAVMWPHQDTVNLMFVGRIAANKRQADLVDCLDHYRRLCEPRARLLLVGACTSAQYLADIERKTRELGLEDAVALLGKVSDEDLVAYYQVADAYLSLSEHEGFGIPLIEAMAFGVPVIAHASSSVPWTVGAGGLLLKTRDPEYVAAAIDTVVRNPGLRRAMRRGARRSVARFDSALLERELAGLLHEVAGPPGPPAIARVEGGVQPHRGYLRIEGPFDSSYSLAIVNRNLALALSELGTPVGLWSTEGYGDFPPDAAFLAANPRVTDLVENGKTPFGQDVTLRFCYPPRTEGMLGLVRAIHTYGWEETGFPRRYVDWFNQRLDLVTVLSTTVKKILIDAGVKIPIAVVGAGVDHLPAAPERASREDSTFRFLHVSSCFPRKAIDVLLEAWAATFTSRDPVRLTIKTFPNPHNCAEADVAACKARHPDIADIEVISVDMDEAALANLYRSADAFVGASRGEGFGMPLAEAMLNGLPVITTAWGGQTDFCDERTAWLVDYSFEYSRSHLVEGVSLWAEPDVRHLGERLREVFAAPAALRKLRTEEARTRVSSRFSWKDVALRTEKAVRTLADLPQIDDKLRVGWITTWNSRCGIAEYSRYLLEAMRDGGASILANRTDDRIAEDDERVVRCWDSGAPSETLDEAYEQILARGLQAIVIQYNFGFFRLPVLAKLIANLRQRGIGVYCIFHATAEFMHGDEWLSLGSIREALAAANRLFVHAPEDLNRLKGYGLVENSTLLAHGVRQPRRIRRPPGAAKVVSSFGFLLPGKGLPELIEAFASLARKDPGLRLKLVNALYPSPVSDDEHRRCVEQIATLGLESRIELVTQFLSEEQVLDQLAEASLVVFPYQGTRESSSAAVRLGIASGRPIAVTPLPVFDDVRGATFALPGPSPADLASGIEELLAQPDLEERSASMIAEWCRHRDWGTMGARLARIIESCAINERYDRAIARIR